MLTVDMIVYILYLCVACCLVFYPVNVLMQSSILNCWFWLPLTCRWLFGNTNACRLVALNWSTRFAAYH